MFFLPWWTYVLIGTASFTCAYAGIWLANIAEPGIKQDDEDGPYPCLAYMGRDVHMGELWCWLLHGHDGDHADQSELPDTAFTREWPEECVDVTTYADEEDLILPPLPQRLSKVPAQTAHADPWPACGHSSMNGTCDLAKGHPGDHSYMCF